MGNLTGDYKLNGFYMLNGIKGTQIGKISCLSNKMIIGTIQDDNKSDKETHYRYPGGIITGYAGKDERNRLILGYISPDLDFRFIKIPCFDQRGDDVYWALKPKEKNKLNFSGGYGLIRREGRKVACSRIPELEGVLSVTDLTLEFAKEFLKDANLEVLQEALFRKDIHDFISKESNMHEWVGEIDLEKL